MLRTPLPPLLLLISLCLSLCFSSPGSLPRSTGHFDPDNYPPWNTSPLIASNGTIAYPLPALPAIWEETSVSTPYSCTISDGVTLKTLKYTSLKATAAKPTYIGGKHDTTNMAWTGQNLFTNNYTPCEILSKYGTWSIIPNNNSDDLPTVDAGTVINARPPPRRRRLRGARGSPRGGGDATPVSSLLPVPPTSFSVFFNCRQVPGDGNCLFHAISLNMLGRDHDISTNTTRLRGLSRELRETACRILKENCTMMLQGSDKTSR